MHLLRVLSAEAGGLTEGAAMAVMGGKFNRWVNRFAIAAPAANRRDSAAVSWWVARAERTVSEEIPAPPNAVRDFYVDLDNIKRVHPLVVAVRATDRRQTADGYVQSYRVQDRIPLGPLHLRISYVARLHVPDTGDVTAEARQFPRVRLAHDGDVRADRRGNAPHRAHAHRCAARLGGDDGPRGGQGAHRHAGGHAPLLRVAIRTRRAR